MKFSLARSLTISHLLVALLSLSAAALYFRPQNLPEILKALFMAAAIAVLAGVLFVRRISRPVDELIRFSREIAQGRFGALPAVESRDEFGRLAEALIQMSRRTEEKISELSRERTELGAILGTLVESVLALDPQGRILFMNPAAETLFQVRSNEAMGRPFLEVLRYSPLSNVLTETLTKHAAVTKEIVLHAPHERVLSVQASPVSYADRQTGVLAALHDITELRRLERIRQEFVANASHELKTPLTSIKGYVETLLDGALDDRKNNRVFLNIIREQSDRLMRLIEDLLDLSAIEAKRVQYRFEAVSLLEVAQCALQGLQQAAESKGITLHNALAPSLPPVRADREKLTQILVNLIDNAIKFNRPRGEVHVAASATEKEISVSIRDTGQGIDAKDLPRVFERFFRADRSHSSEVSGTGLGLAIVKHLVENHQGTVSVHSSPGQGSTFSFTLPRA
jgi:two-component system, OmpR family, phosphate regulon sensor histidine kinase PhoR